MSDDLRPEERGSQNLSQPEAQSFTPQTHYASANQSVSQDAPACDQQSAEPFQSVQFGQPGPQQWSQPAGQQQPWQQPADQHSAPMAQPMPAQTAVKEPKQKAGSVRVFGIAFAGALVAMLLFSGVTGAFNVAKNAITGSNGVSTNVVLGGSGNSISSTESENTALAPAVAQKALPSVVAIDVYTKSSNSLGFGFGYGYSDPNSSSNELTKSSLGSGVVLSADGYIITNNHVIEGADAVKVTIEGNEYDADVVGTDASSDIAVVKAKNASGLTPMDLGDSNNLVIGEWVMTIGSPFGLEQSVATGIVSATSRSQIISSETDGSYSLYANLIQTDAAINPGNSGGALVNQKGQLIGINTLIESYSGNYSGVGFAIPVNYAVNIAQQIIEGKTPTHAELGVSLSNVTAQDAQRYNLAVSEGAYISNVNSGSGAEKAGIEPGDIVTKFDGKKITSASDLMLAIRAKNPGDKVTVVVNRNGSEKSLEVTMGSDENTQKEAAQQKKQQGQQEQNRGYDNSGNGYGIPDELYEYLFGR